MANEAQKTEHSGPKKGRGACWGRKKTAKQESNRVRREMDKSEEKPKSEEEIGGTMREPAWRRDHSASPGSQPSSVGEVS